MRKNTIYSRGDRDSNDNLHKSFAKIKNDYSILNNPNLKKWEATYIPTIASDMRKSACHINSTENLFFGDKDKSKHRWSSEGESSFYRKQ